MKCRANVFYLEHDISCMGFCLKVYTKDIKTKFIHVFIVNFKQLFIHVVFCYSDSI